MIAMSRFSATAMLADMAVDSSKLKSEYVFRVQVNNPQIRLKMLINNEMDAALLPEPQATAARLAGNPVLMDAKNRDLRMGAIVFTDKAMNDSRRRSLQSSVRLHKPLWHSELCGNNKEIHGCGQ